MKRGQPIRQAAILAAFCFNLLLAVIWSNTAYGQEPKLYTAYNIWLVGINDQKFINFKDGKEFIPAGTEVKSVGISYSTPGLPISFADVNLGGTPPYLDFVRVDNKKRLRVSFDSRYHPGKSIDVECHDIEDTF